MLEVTEALNSWRSWNLGLTRAPVVTQSLSSGLTNRSFIIESGDTRLRLRINSPISIELGVNRETELAIHKALEPLNLAPRYLYADSNFHYSVFEYIGGEVWSRNNLQHLKNQQRVQALIEQYQSVQPDIIERNYLDYLNHYKKQLHPSALNQIDSLRLQKFEAQLLSVGGFWPEACLTHHDLIPENILENEGNLYILDWEYASIGCGKLDYLSAGMDVAKQPNLDCRELAYWLNVLWYRIQN